MSKQRIKTGTMMFPEIIQLYDNNIEWYYTVNIDINSGFYLEIVLI